MTWLRELIEGRLPPHYLFLPIVGGFLWAIFSKSEPQKQ